MMIEEIRAGESKDVEFKVERPKESKKYMKSVVAFANGRGGKIIFGVEDNTLAVVGIPNDIVFQEVDAITNAISDSCEPVIVPDITMNTVNGKTVIIVEISAGKQKPYYIKSQGRVGGTYVRVSGTTRPASLEQIDEMYFESEGRSYDRVSRQDISVTDEDIENLCQSIKKVAIANCKNDAQRLSVKDVTKNVLISWGVLEEENGKVHPTNAYVFLLGLDDFLSRIQCAVFKGTTRAIFVDRREYSGPLWQQIEEALQFVLRNIHLGAKIEGIYRKDIYEFPPDSIRELIVNAAVHCSFLQRSLIQIAIYDDRLEITSPGGLMPGVTIEKMKEGYSKIRNQAIARAFSYMNIIEQWGSGIPRIIREVSEYGLREPEFIDMDSALRINIYRGQIGDSDLKDVTNVTKNVTNVTKSVIDVTQSATHIDIGITDFAEPFPIDEEISLETKVLESIFAMPEITQVKLAEKFDVTSRTIKRILAKLQDDGVVYREGSNRKGRWVVKKK